MALSRGLFLFVPFVVAGGAPFACGGPGGSASGALDATDEPPFIPHHFEAGVESSVDAPDEYVAQAPHCARTPDAGAPAAFDAGADAMPDVASLPQVLTQGGSVLASPTFVSVTFPGDLLADELEDFVASLGCTGYWQTVASDYGVGEAVAAPPVRIAQAAAASLDDVDIRAWLTKKIEGADPQFPRPAPGTVYVLFYPDGTQITLQGTTSCQYFGGYHEGAQLSDGTPLSYAVLPRCSGDGETGLASLTVAASHELIEATTDPQPESQTPAYDLPDPAHIGWALFAGAEVGDMCELDVDHVYVPPGYPWAVQRIWSNRAAWAGQSPCVPADTASYFYAAAVPTDTVTLNLVGTPATYPAVHVPVGGTATVTVQLVGNGGVTGTMQIAALDPAELLQQAPSLSLSLDSTVGAPGGTVHLTIQKLRGDATLGAEPFLLQTTLAGRQTLFWGMTSD